MDLFEETEVTPVAETKAEEEHKLEDFMGEGKRYKDGAAVAKSLVAKDTHITRLESEMAALREELNKRLSVEEALTKLEARRNESTSKLDEQHQAEREEDTLSTQDLEKLIESKLSTMTESQKRAANLQVVLQKASETWGDQAQIEINRKAKELGISVADLKAQAESNPNVFYRLVGIDTKRDIKPGTVAPSVDAGKLPVSQGSVKNNAYYKRLLKEDPRTYFSAKVQNEMHAEALKQGESFFN